MKKPILIIGAIIAILLIGAWFWLSSAAAASTAIIYVDSGTVEVDIGNGWTAAVDEMELPQGAKARTGEDGSASIILLEGEVMHLEPNTEVALSQVSGNNMRIKQLAGETWHKVTRISGVSSYEVETPTTVATVRGTEFYVKNDEIAVGEGEVEVEFEGQKKMAKAMHKMRMKAGEMIDEQMMNEPRMAKFREKYVNHLKRIRLREIKKHSAILGMARKQYDVSDERMQKYLEDLDEGRQDVEKAYKDVPSVMRKKAQRAYEITKVIRRAKQAMRTP